MQLGYFFSSDVAMETVDTLFKKFGCKDDQALADIFNKADKSVVSHWRKKGVPAAVERRANEIMRERGIVSEAETPYQSETKKAEQRPITKAVLDLVEVQPEEIQAEAFILLSKFFSDALKQGKP
jgi:hypothetical protein